MKQILATFLILILTIPVFAQNTESTLTETLYSSGKIYVVVVCVVVILLGLLFMLFSVDRRLKKLEKKTAGKN